LEPVPETSAALRELGKYGDTAVADSLFAMGARMQAVVPHLVGVSLALVQEGLSFTLVASNETAARLDAIQYIDGGPCVAAGYTGEVVNFRGSEALDEDRWRLFSLATAAAGVCSTLSMPIMRSGAVFGGVNMYGSTPDAFDDHHEELAQISGAWAPGAVANADLSFRTRLEAAAAPGRLRDRSTVDRAVGVLVGSQGVADPVARELVRQAAARAGITDAQAAEAIIELLAS
jgi:GAF domain-containing protein